MVDGEESGRQKSVVFGFFNRKLAEERVNLVGMIWKLFLVLKAYLIGPVLSPIQTESFAVCVAQGLFPPMAGIQTLLKTTTELKREL